jgi:hypothetical protein
MLSERELLAFVMHARALLKGDNLINRYSVLYARCSWT